MNVVNGQIVSNDLPFDVYLMTDVVKKVCASSPAGQLKPSPALISDETFALTVAIICWLGDVAVFSKHNIELSSNNYQHESGPAGTKAHQDGGTEERMKQFTSMLYPECSIRQIFRHYLGRLLQTGQTTWY